MHHRNSSLYLRFLGAPMSQSITQEKMRTLDYPDHDERMMHKFSGKMRA